MQDNHLYSLTLIHYLRKIRTNVQKIYIQLKKPVRLWKTYFLS